MKPNMMHRTVGMYMEIGCFVSCLFGWILVCSTVPTPFWSYSENSGSVMTTGDAYSNLWEDCLKDNTGASSCKGYPSMMGLSAFIHISRALTISAVITGFFGSVLTLIGMKCTKIGGSEVASVRVTFAGSITYMVSGFCGITTYSWWANNITKDWRNPQYMGAKHELGACIFIGWGGSILLILGGAVLTYISGKVALPSSSQTGHQRLGSHATARTRQTMLEASSPRVTLASQLLYEGRQSQITSATTNMAHAYSRDNFV